MACERMVAWGRLGWSSGGGGYGGALGATAPPAVSSEAADSVASKGLVCSSWSPKVRGSVAWRAGARGGGVEGMRRGSNILATTRGAPPMRGAMRDQGQQDHLDLASGTLEPGDTEASHQ